LFINTLFSDSLAAPPPALPVLDLPPVANENNNQEIDNNNNNNPPAADPGINNEAALDPVPMPTSPNSPTASNERDKLIFLLLNSGTHLDACNSQGKTAADLYKGGKMYQIINPINFLSLQCLAAKVIQRNGIEYRQALTEKLASFVAIH